VISINKHYKPIRLAILVRAIYLVLKKYVPVKTMDVCYSGFLYSTLSTFNLSASLLRETMYHFTQKFWTGLQQKLGGVRPLAP